MRELIKKMGSTTSCSITGISFSSKAKRKDVRKRIIQAVSKDHNSYYVDYDFTVHDTVCNISNEGLQYVGSIRYGTQAGEFRIDKANLCQRFSKCKKRCFVSP
jgi:hypothetical protein